MDNARDLVINEQEEQQPGRGDAMDDEDLSHHMVAMVDALQILGVDPVDATRHVVNIIHKHRASRKPTFIEMYGRGNIVQMANGTARNLNLTGLAALELRTPKPSGEPWDFRQRSDRVLAYRMVREKRPTWLTGSPPCGPVSSWQNINAPRMDPQRRLEHFAEGRMHLRFMINLYMIQLRAGRYFLHAHPETASSWTEDAMRKLMSQPTVDRMVSHQCEYGLFSTSSDGEMRLSKKPTRWLSNSPFMLERLKRRCSGQHEHQQLTGGRARHAETYPPDLILEILRGMRDTADMAHGITTPDEQHVGAYISHDTLHSTGFTS